MTEEVEFAQAAVEEGLDGGDAAPAKTQEVVDLQALGHKLMGEFSQAVKDRQSTEDRWLDDLRQYRGEYGPDVLAKIGKDRSQAFVRKTRVKVKTLDSRVADLLFPAGSEENWTIQSTPKPHLSPEQRKMLVEQMMAAAAQQAQQAAAAQAQQAVAQGQAEQGGMPGGEAPPGAATVLAQAMTGQIPEPPQDAIDEVYKDFAEAAAREMAKTVKDQLTECRYKEASLKAIHSGHMYGLGIMKGPLVEQKLRTSWRKVQVQVPVIDKATGKPMVGDDGQELTEPALKWQLSTETYRAPFIEFVPVWRWYPDMHASEMDGCRFIWELHRMTASKLYELAQTPSFSEGKEPITRFLEANPNGLQLNDVMRYQNELKSLGERDTVMNSEDGSIHVLERWGYISGKDLCHCGVKIDEDRMQEQFFSNIWMLPTGEVIRASLPPINGKTWPYQLYYFDKDETSIFGEGLPMVMRSDQEMLNAGVRMMLDNAAITAGPQLEVMVDLLSSQENTDVIVPWKIWKRNSLKDMNMAGTQAVRAINLQSNLADLAKIVSMFEANADEVTAIPRYMSGENATQGAAGTAAGMSMLMAAANIVIKDLISSWDEGVTRPFIEAMYHWNMRYNSDDRIKGDFDVKARGTASLVAREVRARQLNEASQMLANPLDAPYVDRVKLLRMRAEAQEMGDIIKPDEQIEKEQKSDEVMAQRQLQLQLQQAALAKAQAEVEKMRADTELLTKRAQETVANIDLIVAKAVSTRVEAIFASFQAGGAASNNPFVAPAGDEIYRSGGGKDMGGKADLSDVNRPPVQETVGTQQLLNKGQSFVTPPRGTDNPIPAEQAMPAPAVTPSAELQPATGHVGQRAGVETARIEGAA